MARILIVMVLGVMSTQPTASAGVVVVDALQTGGFFDTGLGPANSPMFQNYHVGYGTTPGFERTPERRSFFWFSVPHLSEEIVSAALHLELPFGGLIFGKGPGDPLSGAFIPSDPVEIFRLSATMVPADVVTSPTLTAAEAKVVFDSFAGPEIAAPVEFHLGGAPPAPVIEIPLNPLGLSILKISAGGDLILTGSMPSWTEDLRLAPPGAPTTFFEASELIFGLTDVHTGAVAKPKLTIVTRAVPEPTTISATTVAVFGGLLLRRLLRRAA